MKYLILNLKYVNLKFFEDAEIFYFQSTDTILHNQSRLTFIWNWLCLIVLSIRSRNKPSNCLLFNFLLNKFYICHAFDSFFRASVMSLLCTVSHQLACSIESMMMKCLSLICAICLILWLLQSKNEKEKVQYMS